ncbi:MAG: hypothetical protein F7B60_05905 [Desulfurococcales archaeon]|nr:hypothetical protein [Desulfurococcales archaeon]
MKHANLLRSTIKNSEEIISKLEPPKIEGKTVVLYCNTGIGPARIYYWTLKISGVENIELVDCVTAITNLLPYTDYDQVIIWNNSTRDPNLVAAYQNSTLMNYPTRILTPILSPALEEYFDPEDLIVFTDESPYFTMSLAALKWGVMGSMKKDLRMNRLNDIVKEGFHESVGGLLEAYSSELNFLQSITNSKGVLVMYTPPQLPAAIHHYLLDPIVAIPSHWSLRVGVRKTPYVVFYGTSVDEGYYKDLWYKLAGSRVTKIILNVDPMTAPLYTMMLQGGVYGKLM